MGVMQFSVHAAGENIAKGKPYVLDPVPNSKDCAGGNAAVKLTDGGYAPTASSKLNNASATAIWMSDATVGWSHTFAPMITIDLGSAQPISGISFSTAAGLAQVSWPEHIFIHTSIDGTAWHDVGDLVALDLRAVPEEGRHKFFVRDLKTHARFVRLIVVGTPYVFSDEIEIYAGSENLLKETPAGEPIKYSGVTWAEDKVESLRPVKRIKRDLELVRQAVASAKPVDPAKLVALDAKLKEIGKTLPTTIGFDRETFRAIMPLNPSHADILSIYGELLNLSGVKPLTVWKKHRFDHLSYLEKPPVSGVLPQVSIDMLGRETRSDSILLSNAGTEPVTAEIRVEGLPDNENHWLRVFYSPWTDTAEGIPVADALVELERHDAIYRVKIPAGLTIPIWLRVDSKNLPAGEYDGTLVTSVGDSESRIPMQLRVSQVAMGQPRLSLGMWDESSGTGGRGITEENMASAIALMREAYVDTPWAEPGVMPQIFAADFNEDGTLNRALGFERLDEWIGRWPGARYYAIFLNVPEEFGGSKIGEPGFSRKVGSWARALEDHVKSLGLTPSQIVLLPVDEPRTDAQDIVTAAWISGIKGAGTSLTIMTNPIWEKPQDAKHQEAITQADVVCPNLRIFTEGGASVEKYFAERRNAGQTMWFYLCEGPVRHFDPHSYYRLQAWKAFQHNATGISFWSFGDLGGARSSWNEYAPKKSFSYAPAFLSEKEATDSIHWQAVREGVQDYEYLAMLRDILPKANAAQAREARAVLDGATRSILAGYSTDYRWKKEADRSAPDQLRIRVIRLLEQIQGVQMVRQETPVL